MYAVGAIQEAYEEAQGEGASLKKKKTVWGKAKSRLRKMSGLPKKAGGGGGDMHAPSAGPIPLDSFWPPHYSQVNHCALS